MMLSDGMAWAVAPFCTGCLAVARLQILLRLCCDAHAHAFGSGLHHACSASMLLRALLGVSALHIPCLSSCAWPLLHTPLIAFGVQHVPGVGGCPALSTSAGSCWNVQCLALRLPCGSVVLPSLACWLMLASHGDLCLLQVFLPCTCHGVAPHVMLQLRHAPHLSSLADPRGRSLTRHLSAWRHHIKTLLANCNHCGGEAERCCALWHPAVMSVPLFVDSLQL